MALPTNRSQRADLLPVVAMLLRWSLDHFGNIHVAVRHFASWFRGMQV